MNDLVGMRARELCPSGEQLPSYRVGTTYSGSEYRKYDECDVWCANKLAKKLVSNTGLCYTAMIRRTTMGLKNFFDKIHTERAPVLCRNSVTSANDATTNLKQYYGPDYIGAVDGHT